MYKMLTHKGECSRQREQILQTKKSHVFLFIHILLIVSQKRGGSILLYCVPQLACKSVNFLIGQWPLFKFPFENEVLATN